MVRKTGAVVIILLLAGCAGSEASGTTAEQVVFDDNTGAIQGAVTDDSFVPIAGATVQALPEGPTTTSEADGSFGLGLLPPGSLELLVTASGFAEVIVRVDVVAGAVTTSNVVLQPLPTEDAYHVLQLKYGKIFCGTAWRYPRIFVPNVINSTGGAFAACGVFFGTPLNDTDSFVVPFETARDAAQVEGMVFETTWQATQVFGKGLNVGWEAAQDIVAYSLTEKLRTFIRVYGAAPLQAQVNQSVIEQNVTLNKDTNGKLPKYCQAGAPCRYWGRIFPYASTFGSSSMVDFAFYLDQRYTHYVSEFYGAPNPPDYTALPDR